MKPGKKGRRYSVVDTIGFVVYTYTKHCRKREKYNYIFCPVLKTLSANPPRRGYVRRHRRRRRRRRHHRCRSGTRDGDDDTRNQRGARNADSEHRPPNAGSHAAGYYDGSREREGERRGRRNNEEREKTGLKVNEEEGERTRRTKNARTRSVYIIRWSWFAEKKFLDAPSESRRLLGATEQNEHRSPTRSL